MSNDICGYVLPVLDSADECSLQSYIDNSRLGIARINVDELYNFPSEFIPATGVFSFLIGDYPDYPNATYLIDYNEYDPDILHGNFLPRAKDRIDLLLNTLQDIIKLTKATKMIVALTECNQITTIKRIKLSELHNVIHADFEIYQAPPDTLYEVTI